MSRKVLIASNIKKYHKKKVFEPLNNLNKNVQHHLQILNSHMNHINDDKNLYISPQKYELTKNIEKNTATKQKFVVGFVLICHLCNQKCWISSNHIKSKVKDLQLNTGDIINVNCNTCNKTRKKRKSVNVTFMFILSIFLFFYVFVALINW